MIGSPVAHARRIAVAAVVLAFASLASACLSPTQFDPTGRAPIGNLEVVANAAGGIRVSGWALDPETSAPVEVKVGVAGVVRQVTADLDRPDVARAHRGKGPRHGFDYVFGPLEPGLRGICVWVDNTVGRGDDRLLGCANIQVTDGSPIGALEAVTSSSPRSITVSGWAFDPSTPAAARVAVTVDGRSAATLAANGTRADVQRAHRRSRSGFSTGIAATPGRHQVCVGVFNVGFGSDRLLGCRNVSVAESSGDYRPRGRLDRVEPTGADSVLVQGVAQDPDGAYGLRVRLDVDAGTPGARSTVVPVVNGRFSVNLDGLGAGPHKLCPVGLDVDGGRGGIKGDRRFICGSTTLGDVAVGTGGASQNPTWVAPPTGSLLSTTSRDAGVSVVLRDGSTMWFFGDTSDTDALGNLKYFVHNTAAWAAAGSPTVTRDAVAAGGKPYQFASAPHSCGSPSASTPALWPESAVAVPRADGTDRVLVFMSKVCLGTGFLDIEPKGIALVEVTYDPRNPPAERRISGTLTKADLFGVAHPYGRAAVLGSDADTIYAYECGQFDSDNWAAPRPCTVGRVPFANRTDPGSWTYWTGSVGDDFADASNWSPNSALATGMRSPTGSDVAAPVAAFTITRDDLHGAYLMVYSPFPGFTDRVEVRVAVTPVGPFTDPVTVVLPGCNDTAGGVEYLCYAGTAQPSLSRPGLLGIGYYDQLITPSPKRGQYMTVTVPFAVVLTAGR